jgi:hypothetical protein
MTTRPTPTPVRSRIVGEHGDARDFHITGPITDLQALIAVHAAKGTLVHATAPQPYGPTDAATRLRLRNVIHGTVPVPYPHAYRPTPTPGTPVPPSPNHLRAAVIAVTISGALAGLLSVAAFLLGQLVELIVAHAVQILGGLALVALIAALVARRGSGRRHCPGC